MKGTRDWISIEIDLPDHPKVRRMARALSLEPDSVVGKLVRVWGWFDRNSVDGVVDALVDADVDDLARHEGFAEALRDVGWLNEDPETDQLSIPRFDAHHGNSLKKRLEKSTRQQRWREKKRATRASTVDADVDGTVDADVDASVDVTRVYNVDTNSNSNSNNKKTSSSSRAGARAEATSAAKACRAMINAGAVRANPSNPNLLAALTEGVTAQELADTAEEAVRLNRSNPFTWAISVARKRHAEGALPINQKPETRHARPRTLTPSERVAQAIAAQGPDESHLAEDD